MKTKRKYIFIVILSVAVCAFVSAKIIAPGFKITGSEKEFDVIHYVKPANLLPNN